MIAQPETVEARKKSTGYHDLDEMLLLLYEADVALGRRGKSTEAIHRDERRLLVEGMRRDRLHGIV